MLSIFNTHTRGEGRSPKETNSGLYSKGHKTNQTLTIEIVRTPFGS